MEVVEEVEEAVKDLKDDIRNILLSYGSYAPQKLGHLKALRDALERFDDNLRVFEKHLNPHDDSHFFTAYEGISKIFHKRVLPIVEKFQKKEIGLSSGDFAEIKDWIERAGPGFYVIVLKCSILKKALRRVA